MSSNQTLHLMERRLQCVQQHKAEECSYTPTSWQNRKEKSEMVLRFVYVQREVAGKKPAYISNPVARQSFPWISCIYYRTISANITIIAKYCKLDLDRHLDLVLHLDLRLDIVFVYIESNIVACTTITKYQNVCTASMPKWQAKP